MVRPALSFGPQCRSGFGRNRATFFAWALLNDATALAKLAYLDTPESTSVSVSVYTSQIHSIKEYNSNRPEEQVLSQGWHFRIDRVIELSRDDFLPRENFKNMIKKREYFTKNKCELLTQQRMMSQMTSIGASDFNPRGFTWVPEIRYPALITADLKITADGEVHLRVPQRLCKLRKRGTSGNSCKINN